MDLGRETLAVFKLVAEETTAGRTPERPSRMAEVCGCGNDGAESGVQAC